MTSLHVRSVGSGPDLVLVHGFGGSHAVWGAIQDRLAGSARVHAVDLPGHADSLDYPGAGPAKVAASAILETMDALGVGPFHLAGHSLGGAVATLVALTAPDRVLSLALFAPGGCGPEINIRLLKRFAAARDPAALEAALENMVGFRHPVSTAAVELLRTQRDRPGQTEMLVGLAGKMTRDGRQGTIPRDQIAGLAMPVRVMWGMQDNVLPAHTADGLPENCRVERLAETGHMLIEEAPDAVEALLAAQIAATSAAP